MATSSSRTSPRTLPPFLDSKRSCPISKHSTRTFLRIPSSMHETRTAGIAAKRLRDAGFDVTIGVGKTGVVGVLRNGEGPVAACRHGRAAGGGGDPTAVCQQGQRGVQIRSGLWAIATPAIAARGSRLHCRLSR